MSSTPRPATFFCAEEMEGYLTIGALEFEKGFAEGQRDDTYLVVKLQIHADDVRRFANEPEHAARLEGQVICDAIGGTLAVEQGFFNLFVDTANPMRKRMNYRLFITAPVGPLTFTGFKAITDDPRFGIWSDCAILYSKILRGHVLPNEEQGAEVYATGLIFLYFIDFLKINALTFKIRGPLGAMFKGYWAFFSFFFHVIWTFYKAKLRGKT